MYYSDETLKIIHSKTEGHCYHCQKQIPLNNYGERGGNRGRWEVDHGNPISRGGVNDNRNWHASCVPCNRHKSDKTTSEYHHD
jgi:5-methylcytosine-specific restriction endonuclease McrA